MGKIITLNFNYIPVADINRLEHVTLKTVSRYNDWCRALGITTSISPVTGATIRFSDRYHTSQHYYGRAIDVMLNLPVGAKPLLHLTSAAIQAKIVGFTGIGVYPDWKPFPGLHLDTRPGKLAQWGAKKNSKGVQYYVGIEEVIGTRLVS